MDVKDETKIPNEWRSEPRFMDCLSPACALDAAFNKYVFPLRQWLSFGPEGQVWQVNSFSNPGPELIQMKGAG
jgi:hypothetical protein